MRAFDATLADFTVRCCAAHDCVATHNGCAHIVVNTSYRQMLAIVGKSPMSTKQKPLKTLETLGANDCRWPVGDPRQANFHFCGEAVAAGRPYCACHWDLSRQGERSRSESARVAPPAMFVRRAA
ncbi:MAG: hypothetical protein JSS20_00780 [Proteobacteria bacterium]|nr:hypothetical protein [Pseudomonadota bacterium]